MIIVKNEDDFVKSTRFLERIIIKTYIKKR